MEPKFGQIKALRRKRVFEERVTSLRNKAYRKIALSRKEYNETELGYTREQKNFWSSNIYYLYCAFIGNGIVGIPEVMRFSFDVSAGFCFFISLLATIFLCLPIIYIETYLGHFSKLTNSQMYRMAPVTFGMCAMNFLVNCLYFPIMTSKIAIFLIGVFKFIAHWDYMSKCIKPHLNPMCYDYRVEGSLINDTCKHDYMSLKCEQRGRIAYVSAYLYWKNFRDYYEELEVYDYENWQITLTALITWFLITVLVLFGLRVIYWVFIGSAISYITIFLAILLMALVSDGSSRGMSSLFKTNVNSISIKETLFIMNFISIKMCIIAPTGHMTYVAYTHVKNAKIRIRRTCFLVIFVNFVVGCLNIIIMFLLCGIVSELYGLEPNQVLTPFIGTYFSLVVEFLHYRKASTLFIIIYFASVWTLETIKLAIAYHFHIMNLMDFCPTLVPYNNYSRIIFSCIFAILSILCCAREFTQLYIPMYFLINLTFLQPMRLLLQGIMCFYLYGSHRLDDDIKFMTNFRAYHIIRALWPIYPILNFGIIILMVFICAKNIEDEEKTAMELDVVINNQKTVLIAGVISMAIYLIGSSGFIFLYITTGIGSTTSFARLIKPDFHWGPPTKDERIRRKKFQPRLLIKSRPHKNRVQRFKQASIRQMHQRDAADDTYRGRIFLDATFFSGCGYESRGDAEMIEHDPIIWY